MHLSASSPPWLKEARRFAVFSTVEPLAVQDTRRLADDSLQKTAKAASGAWDCSGFAQLLIG
jgi:hypothetical protein